MKLFSKTIEPGQNQEIRIPVGRLPSDTSIAIRTFIFRSKKPGPTCLVMGGVHGDEINGVEIVRRAMQEKVFENLTCGSVIAIPLVNVYGFINFSRDLPDGKDVNRSFPGNRMGSLASRVAYTVSKHIIPLIDFGMDFHTGGKSIHNYPQIRFSLGHKESEAMARAFAPPVIVGNKPIPKTMRHHALKHGKPVLVYEGGESLRIDGFSIQRGLSGIKRVLKHKGMLDGKLAEQKSLFFENNYWVRAPRSGIFEWSQAAGSYVRPGEPLGRIGDPYCRDYQVIYAKKRGFIYGHNNAPVVSLGDALYHIAY